MSMTLPATGADRRAALGILGGMGPIASAEFLKTIYEASAHRSEQQAPPVVLHSDPSMPDRTSAFLNGRTDVVLGRFVAALQALEQQGVSRIVICCVTIHYLLPRLPPEMRNRIVSLLDVISNTLSQSPERHLLLCTTGTRQLRLFETHPAWAMMRDKLVLPDAEDQDVIHQTIYRVKAHGDVELLVSLVERLLAKYGVTSFVAGCTEIHLATKRVTAKTGFGCVDPLLIVAHDLVEGRI
jgi:aspartate racemase